MLTYADVFRCMPFKGAVRGASGALKGACASEKKNEKKKGAVREAAGAFKRACAAEGRGGGVSSCTDGDGGG